MPLPPKLPPRLPAPNHSGPAQVARQVAANAQTPPQQVERFTPSWNHTISTGSTLLDLAISGLKCEYGGIPGGAVVEIYGDSGLGKTTIAGEIAGGCQRAGGDVWFDGPEHRLDPEYCEKMGIQYVPERLNYPDTFTELEEIIIGPLEKQPGGKMKRATEKAWTPDKSKINCRCIDSVTALCSRMELEQGDKMGQRRALDASNMFRRITRHIRHYNIITVFTNQIRDNVVEGPGAKFAPKTKSTGGHAGKFYADIRIELRHAGLIKTGTKPDEIILGKYVEAKVIKSSKDIEYRSAKLRIIFGYGIDNLGANIEWLKQHGELNTLSDGKKTVGGYVLGGYYIPSNISGGALRAAIEYAEENNLERDIMEQVTALWRRLELEARPVRKDKFREEDR